MINGLSFFILAEEREWIHLPVRIPVRRYACTERRIEEEHFWAHLLLMVVVVDDGGAAAAASVLGLEFFPSIIHDHLYRSH